MLHSHNPVISLSSGLTIQLHIKDRQGHEQVNTRLSRIISDIRNIQQEMCYWVLNQTS